MNRFTPLFLVVLASGCIEQGLEKEDGPAVGTNPNILVDPPALAFMDLPVGDEEIRPFTVSNVGGAALNVFDVVIGFGEEAYRVVDTNRTFTLAPGEDIEMHVAFMPLTQGEIYGVVQVLSDDPDGDNSTVDLLGGGVVPNILVEPALISFGGLPEGGSDIKPFSIKNIGPAPLLVTDIQLVNGQPAFEVQWSEAAFELGTNEEVVFDVVFAPGATSDVFDGLVQVVSNDPDNDNSTVELEGFGLVPNLEISPAIYDFGQAFVPCGDHVDLTLANIGADDLIITDIAYSAGGMLTLDNPLLLPLTLAPGGSAVVGVDFVAAAGNDTGTITVTSNDPQGLETAEQLAEGLWQSSPTEIYQTPGAPPVDVLIMIDQSCSMEDENQTDVEAGFPDFVTELQNVADWRLMLVTDAFTGCATGGVLDNTVPNVDTLLVNGAFNGAHDDNTGANRTEKLLELAEVALSKTNPGNCNEGFLRPGALLHIINLSDEPEQSNQTAAFWVGQLDAYVSDPSLLKISGVLDLSNCGTGAAGYIDAINITGGASLDICSSTWGQNFTDIANAVLLGIPTYPLTSAADPLTMKVLVNGVPTYDFAYDPATQSVTVNSPAIGELDEVTVTYNVPATCP